MPDSGWGLDLGSLGAMGGCGAGEDLGKETLKEGMSRLCTCGIRMSSESQILEVQGHREEALLVPARPSCFGPEDQEAGTPGPKFPHHLRLQGLRISFEAWAGLGNVPATEMWKVKHGACWNFSEGQGCGFLIWGLWTAPRSGRGMDG